MKMGMPKTEKEINKIKNGAIYQAKSMGWIGDESPYLDDTEESTDQELDTAINDNETNINDNSNTSNSSTSTSSSSNSNSKANNDNETNINDNSNTSNSSTSTSSSSNSNSKANNNTETNQTQNNTAPNLYNTPGLYVATNLKLIYRNINQEDLNHKEVKIKVNGDYEVSQTLGYWNFVENNLDFSYQLSIPIQNFSTNLKIEIYINGELIKQKIVTVDSIENKRIEDYHSYKQITINDIFLDITN